MKTIILSLAFVFLAAIFLNAREQAPSFDNLADRINVIIAIELLKDKNINIDGINDDISYDSLINLKLPPANKKVAMDINNYKNFVNIVFKSSSVKDKLTIFKSLALNPIRVDDVTRLAKISILESIINKITIDVENISKEQTDTTKITGGTESNNPFEFINLITFVIIGFVIIIAILSIFNFTNSSKQKKILHKFRDDLTDYEGMVSQIKERISSNNAPRGSSNISDAQLQQIISRVISEIETRNKENSFYYSPTTINAESVDSSQNKPVETLKPIIQYIESPEKEGYFDKSFLTNSEKPNSLYQITFYKDKDQIEFDIIEGKYNIHRSAMNNSTLQLKPACDYDQNPSQNHKQIIKISNKNGTLIDEGNKLQIIDKIKIKFG